MNTTFDTILLQIMSLKNFQDAKLAYKVISKINEYGKDYIPQVFGYYEPLKQKYDINDSKSVVDIWINEESDNSVEQFACSNLMMEKKKGHKVEYSMSWKKDNTISFNSFSLNMKIDYYRESKHLESFINLCKDFIELLEPVYGAIANCSYPDWGEPINLRIRLPDIVWGTILGEPYISMFGKEKLLNTPCYKIETIGGKTIFLQASDNIFNPVEETLKNKIKKYLDEDAFVWDGKDYRRYKTGKVPEFDFSEILYDKTKPIIEPQVKTRKNK